MFHGFDFDNTMLRIGSMNMALHGVENPDIRYRDSLAQDHAGDEGEVHAACSPTRPSPAAWTTRTPPRTCSQIVKTKKTELLFLALFLRLLKPGGRAAVIVPDGVLFGSSKAHKELRRMLVEDHKLDAVICLPGGVLQALRGRVHRHPALHQDQLRRHRSMSGSMTCRPTAGAWTTSASRCCRSDKLGPVPQRGAG
jgi:type I restriction enzyme M protein